MGIRPAIWGLMGLGLAVLALILTGGDRGPEPGPDVTPGADGVAWARAGPARGIGAGSDGTARAADRGPAIRRAGAPGAASVRARGGGREVGPSGAGPGRRPDGDGARGEGGYPSAGRDVAPPDKIDPELERAVARAARSLGLLVAPRAAAAADGDAAPETSVRDPEIVAAADAAMTEFRLRQVLWERFHRQGQLVPWGFPVNRLRSELALEVAGLPTSQRNELLELSAAHLPHQARPIMSHPGSGNLYRGRDGDSNPRGVDVYVPPTSR